MSGADEDLQTWAVRVQGRVQGIGFRDACVQQARALGLTGWVRNRADGSVEALLQGRAAPLAGMRDWLAGGMPRARIDRLEIDPIAGPATRHERFERLPTPKA